ncbi:MAG: IS630 family transposase [Nocardioidaceae bacterium]
MAWRAQIVLWADEGQSAADIARMAKTSKPTVYKWVDRYAKSGVAGLESRKSTGRPQSISGEVRARILALTRKSPPESTGLTHWSSGEMAKYLKRHEGISVSHNFVSVLWRENGLQPHRQGTFKLSKDPDFAMKVADVVGLYLNPPHGAVVLSMDEKTQVQALDRTQPMLPMDFGKTEKRTHDYVRHGTTNLFAALNTRTGEVIGRCFDRRRTVEFIKFLDQAIRRYPRKEIHVIVDNLSTHDGDDIDKWLKKHPKVTFHYTPKGSSWMNQVETWFGIITRQAIRRGAFRSVRQLIQHIQNYITHWNEDATPFEWTATADEIIGKVQILERDFRRLLDCNQNQK